MKQKIKSIGQALTVLALTAPVAVLAQFAPPSGTNLPSGSVFSIVRSIMNWLLGIVGIFGVIGFAIAGILYLTAAGSEDQIATAKKAMMMSIVGVVVALVGLVIITAANSLLTGSNSQF